MIPHSMLSNENEIFGNGSGLKDRVTACRKRLRLNRIQRAHADNQLEALFLETAIRASEFRGSSGNDAVMRAAFVPAPERVEVRGGETPQPVDEQEVGIT